MSTTQTLADFASAVASGDNTVIDLLQALPEGSPLLVLPDPFGQTAAFSRGEISRYDDRDVAWHGNNFAMGEHTGAGVDAPVHWVTGNDPADCTVDHFPQQVIVAPAAMLDFLAECAAKADFLLTAEHIKSWESGNSAIPPRSWVLFRSDWSKHDVNVCTNRREDGAHTRGPTTGAIEYLFDRDVMGFGVETIGTDNVQTHLLTPPYPAHTPLHGAGKFGLQCLENLGQPPAADAIGVAAPLQIRDSLDSPLRVLALAAG